MYQPVTTNKFDRELLRVSRRGKDLSKIQRIMNMLAAGKVLPPRNKDHSLVGNFVERRECHIEPDWLLIYKIDEKNKKIVFERTGSHSDLF